VWESLPGKSRNLQIRFRKSERVLSIIKRGGKYKEDRHCPKEKEEEITTIQHMGGVINTEWKRGTKVNSRGKRRHKLQKL